MNVYFCLAFSVFLFNAIVVTVFGNIEGISSTDMLAVVMDQWADLGIVAGLWVLYNLWRKRNDD